MHTYILLFILFCTLIGILFPFTLVYFSVGIHFPDIFTECSPAYFDRNPFSLHITFHFVGIHFSDISTEHSPAYFDRNPFSLHTTFHFVGIHFSDISTAHSPVCFDRDPFSLHFTLPFHRDPFSRSGFHTCPLFYVGISSQPCKKRTCVRAEFVGRAPCLLFLGFCFVLFFGFLEQKNGRLEQKKTVHGTPS